MASPLDYFSALWLRAREGLEGLPLGRVGFVFYERLSTGADAEYRPEGPTIRIHRAEVPSPDWEPAPDATVEEACNLAHEYGHHLSAEGGTRTAAYDSALEVFNSWHHPQAGAQGLRCPTREEQGLVLGEERIAWAHAEAVLSDLGVTEWSAFTALREKSLAAYTEQFRNMELPGWVKTSPTVL